MQIPEVNGPQVTPDVQPSVSAQGQMPLEAAGGGAKREALNQTNEQMGAAVGETIALQTMKANQVAVAKAATAYNQAVTAALYGDENTPGFLTKRGQEAIDAANPTVDAIKSLGDKFSEGLVNDDQRRMFLHQQDSLLDMANKQVHAHLDQQIQVTANDATNGLVKTNIDMAAKSVGTPNEAEAVEMAKQQVQDAIWQHGVNHLGDFTKDADGNRVAGDMTNARIQEAMSTLNLNVLDAKLAVGNAHGAAEYAKANKDDIDPVKYKALMDPEKGAITQEIDRSDADAKARSLFQKYSDDKAAAMTATEKLPDRVRTQARSLLNEMFSDKKAADDQRYSDTYNQALDIVQKTGQMPPGNILGVLNDTDQKTLNNVRIRLKNGTAAETDMTTLQSLKDMATSTDPKDKNDFMHENLAFYADKLSMTDLKSLENAQRALRTKNPNAMADVNSWRQQTEVGNEAMRGIGWDPGVSKDPKVIQFKADLDKEIQVRQAQSKVPLTRDDIVKAAQDVAVKAVRATNGPAVKNGQADPIIVAQYLKARGIVPTQYNVQETIRRFSAAAQAKVQTNAQ
jgi:hypothetical protein